MRYPIGIVLLGASLALLATGCGQPGPSKPAERIVGAWEATDGSGCALHFDAQGKLALETQGKILDARGDYRFVDSRRVEVTGPNFLVTINGRPLPMGFTVDFDEPGRSITITPGPERADMLQFALFGNGKFHTFPPVKAPATYRRRD